MDNQRNLILAVVLSLALLLGWDLVMSRFFPQPEAVVTSENATPEQIAADSPTQAVEIERDLATELASADRVRIDAPEIEGSINLLGARVDDIEFKTHRETIAPDSGPVQFMAPLGTDLQHFARFDWLGEGVTTPTAQTVWTADGEMLTQDTPVTLSWDNGEGQVFALTYAVDEHYMLTVRQAVTNNGEGTIAVRPRALINRTSETADRSTWNVHSGPIASIDGSVNFDWDYDEVAEEPNGQVRLTGRPGWVGFTDIYWMSALIPDAGAETQASFTEAGADKYAAVLLYDTATVGSGQTLERTTQLFAGAKESAVLDSYQDAGIEQFGLAIDWGWFRFIAWPMWQVLIFLFDLVGNFGLAIICLTVIIRLLMFPIAQKQFASMAQMRAVQPKMKALQERYKDDKAQLQQEMAKLYKEEKVNPLAGCLPIFLQIPIFFALYKTLLLAIEMRHQPFYGWIHDLSAPDPAKILNLFGLLPFDPPGFLGIGILAVLLGFTMWLQFKLNPAAMDPMQQQIFMIMPWVLMFVMAPFAAGLLLYWITSNLLTLAQQKYLYSRHPQLKAQAEKDAADKARAAERDKA
ncbi:membrane protein insertase YidC [Alteraurantiacibacter aquimixticola]|uniref:Membrane protein insertase YidC n=1 Tax=Alteraurantiacibacter aquimixticola TaxID=2489173 RepID=A0A4T3F410_9SPHN|nr:membrane protein insertase YidC [Alteraurantiacibacter aquimixticola]TIX51034.1 membrane protein insertase YidC [Alteraurantiacibacter aquimixticola]